MTSVVDVPADREEASPTRPRASNWINRFEAALEHWSERLNPILVKEARQALKSKQFTVTFTLLLIAGWVWSVIGVIAQMPSIYYSPSGLAMLAGYYVILAIPLLLIVPFSSFRSLASEREDGTYELLSISALTSRQIVTGKLGSSLLQMMVYYSALAPCIAFTYMLRGVDLISIALLLFYTFCVSVLLSVVGLVFAGLTRSRHWQTLISVALLLALVVFSVGWAAQVVEIIDRGLEDLPLDDADFWIGQLAIVTFLLSYLVILIQVAAAQNSFDSDNRSTRIRVALSAQAILYIGWATYGWIRNTDLEFVMVAMFFAAGHWVVYGILLTGESAKLSPRVRRQLPQSVLGRVLLTWFNPGSGTGYVFAVSHVALFSALAVFAGYVQHSFGVPAPSFARQQVVPRLMESAIFLCAYVVAYLGFSRLLIVAIPQRERYGLLLPTLIHVLVLLGGAAIPFVYEGWRRDYNNFDYSIRQVTNWLWTLVESVNRGTSDPMVMLIVSLGAIMIFIANLVVMRGEVQVVRIDAPERVRIDDLAHLSTPETVVVDPLSG